MKLDDISQKQLIISLGSAVIVLTAIMIFESYEFQKLVENSDKMVSNMEPLYFQWMDAQNCNTLDDLKSYTIENNKHHGVSAQAWGNEIIKRIEEKCGNAS